MNTVPAELLDQCISDVRAGRKTVEECLAAYPEHQDALEPLLTTAISIRAPIVRPDPQRKLEARHAFVEAIAQEPRRHRQTWWRLPTAIFSGELLREAQTMRLAALAINILAILILATSAVASAKEAQPGDLLYGLKTGIEQVQVAVALTPETRAQIRLQIAAERLNEVKRALASDRTMVADTAATAYAATMDQAQRDIATARPTGERLDSIQRTLQENLVRQQEVLVQASEKGAVGTEHAIREVQAHHTISLSTGPAGSLPGGGVDVSGAVQPRDSTSQEAATVNPSGDANSVEDELSPSVVQTDTPAIASQPPAATATPTAPASNLPSSAVTSDSNGREPTPAAQSTATTPTGVTAVPSRTPTATLTPTRRATVTPSATPPTPVASQTTPSPSLRPSQRGGVSNGDEVGRSGAIETTSGFSATSRTPTMLATSTPTPQVFYRGGPPPWTPTLYIPPGKWTPTTPFQ